MGIVKIFYSNLQKNKTCRINAAGFLIYIIIIPSQTEALQQVLLLRLPVHPQFPVQHSS